MRFALWIALGLASGAGSVAAQDSSHSPFAMDHEVATSMPTEPGQGAFAAISEIVAMLAADPTTDWQNVDITALRDHLVDMDSLVTDTDLSQREVSNGLEMTIPVLDRSDSAILRMVPAHAPVLAAETGWASGIEDAGDHLVWTVTDPDEAARIRALGFFGLMATGDHHRAHHLGIATGSFIH